MKNKSLASITVSFSLLSLHVLFGQYDDKLQEDISQQVQLTKACNNSDRDLNCYLMMDPEEARNAQDLFGSLSGTVLPIREADFTTIESESSVKAECSISSEHANKEYIKEDSIETFIQENNSNNNILRNSILNIQEKVLAITHQIEEAKQTSKEKRGGENACFGDHLVTKLEQARDSWKKVSETLAQGKQEKSVLWRKVAEESEVSAQGIFQVIQAYIAGNEEEAQQLEKKVWNAYHLSNESIWLLKSEEAGEAGEETLAVEYKNSVEISQNSEDYRKKARLSYELGKASEAESFAWLSDSYLFQADYQTKACEAQQAGNTTLAASYREAAAISKLAADKSELAILAFVEGKESEGNSWSAVSHSLQTKADYLVKASAAQEGGKTTLATDYREASATLDQAVDRFELGVEVKIVGKEDEGFCCYLAGVSLQKKADYQIKASEAQEGGKTTLADGYREAASISQYAADQYKKAARTHAAGKESEANSWKWKGTSLQKKADYLVKASEAQEGGKTTLAVGYREAAAISQYAVEKWKLGAETEAEGKEREGNSWGYEAMSLQARADYEAKAIEAEEEGGVTIGAANRRAAAASQRAAEHYRQSAHAYATGNQSEGERLFTQGEVTQEEANAIAEGAEESGGCILS